MGVTSRLGKFVPERGRRWVRRLIPREQPVERVRLELVHTEDTIVVAGSVAQHLSVVGLVARIPGTIPAREITFSQPPASTFDFTVPIDQLAAALTEPEGQFDLFLHLAKRGGGTTEWRLGRFAETDRTRSLRPIARDGVPVWSHVTGAGNVSIVFAETPVARHRSSCQRLVVRRGRIEFTIVLESFSRPATSMAGVWVSRTTHRETQFPVTVHARDSSASSGLHSYEISGSVAAGDLVDPADEEGVFDLYVQFEYLDVGPQKAVVFQGPRWHHRLRHLAIHHEDHVQLLVPYLTFRGKRVAFWSERFEPDTYRFMQRLRLVSWLFGLVRPFTGIWLVGEIPDKAQDNGLHFFRWLRTHHPERRAYYVIDAASPDRPKVEALGQVVLRRSKRHVLLSHLASRFVGTHHAEFLFASRSPTVARRSAGLRVFLQHGVTAAKNVTLNYGRRLSGERPFDVVCVNSELERRIMIQELEFLPSQAAITGFARFDALFAAAEQPPTDRRILVMPTWRDYLMRIEVFSESSFLANWRAFLADPRVHAAAAEHGATVELLLHPNMRQFAHLFDLPGVVVHQPGEDVQSLITGSTVLVTDYSSVAWDFAFLDRPVLYFQFDQADFLDERVPFIDYTTQLPGDIARTPDQLTALLGELLANGAVQSPEHHARARAFLDHRDQQNCQRIHDVVRNADGLRARATRIRSSRFVRETYVKWRRSPSYHPMMTWVYRVAKHLPKKNSIIFESDRGRSYGGNPRALYEELLRRDTGMEIAFVNNTPARLPDLGTRKVRRLSPRYYWEMARARYWVFNQNAPDQFVPGGGTHYHQTWHGTPLKKMQNDVATMYGRTDDYHVRAQKLVNAWTSLLSPSPFASQAFRSAFGFTGEIIEQGYPCNDVFSAPDLDERTRVVRSRLGIADDRRVVLYAPTFRDNRRKGVNWTADLALDLQAFRDRHGADTTLLVRFHPLVRFVWPAGELDDTIIDVSTYPDTQDLLLVTDVLITDYSSIMFDFAQSGRQSLFYTYDIELYRDTLRGFYFDFENEAPGPLLSTSDEVLDALGDLERIESEYAERRQAFRQRFGPFDDGHAGSRVLDALLRD